LVQNDFKTLTAAGYVSVGEICAGVKNVAGQQKACEQNGETKISSINVQVVAWKNACLRAIGHYSESTAAAAKAALVSFEAAQGAQMQVTVTQQRDSLLMQLAQEYNVTPTSTAGGYPGKDEVTRLYDVSSSRQSGSGTPLQLCLVSISAMMLLVSLAAWGTRRCVASTSVEIALQDEEQALCDPVAYTCE
jgi:hypothetical protein